MTLLTFKHSGQEEGDVRHKTGITGRRWALTIEPYSIGLFHEIQFKGGPYSYGAGYYICSVTPRWDWGYKDLGWYDGPHESFSLGFLHFSWSR